MQVKKCWIFWLKPKQSEGPLGVLMTYTYRPYKCGHNPVRIYSSFTLIHLHRPTSAYAHHVGTRANKDYACTMQ